MYSSTPRAPVLLKAACCLVLLPSLVLAGETRLSTLDLSLMTAGWGKAQPDKSIAGKPLTIAGHAYAHGVSTHARSLVWVRLDKGSDRFRAFVGVDDSANQPKSSIQFKVIGEGRTLWDSGVMRRGDSAKQIDLSVAGLEQIALIVGDAGDGVEFDHADWAEAVFVGSGPVPKTVPIPVEKAEILTPPPGPKPKINGPSVYGCRPNHPFLYRIPATGTRPMTFSAKGLPAGLNLNPSTGIITGTSPARGEYQVTLQAKNSQGNAKRSFRIVSGDTLSLTPSMGWNHWYAHYDRVTDKMMREAADIMVSSGMADVGYQYVNIDDCWMFAPKQADPLRVGPLRDEQGRLLPNKHFPDMKALTDYIHSKGLKAGTYTSPGPLTCGGFAGAYQHEAQDAKSIADWGFDFLKYDWCSYGDVVKGDSSLEALKKPYQQMGDLLKQQPRDILFNLCQYGMGEVWKWGESVGGQSWRTSGDLGFELNRIFEVALKNAEHRDYSKPGSWNDPDYVQIGYVGNAREGGQPQPCPLTPNEQYSFMSLWALMASPLFFSGDMSKLDPFTINVLCNPEVIEIDQDPLGESARVVMLGDDTFIMVKRLVDGSHAVGLCNKGEVPAELAANWSALGLSKVQKVRDVWRHKDLGKSQGSYKAIVPRRAVLLLRTWSK
jgi:alpha-galactosidase